MAKNLTKLLQSKKLKLVSATSMVIFSLFVCFSGAYAWYSTIQTVTTESNDFKIDKARSSVGEITFYRYLGESVKEGGEDGTTYFGFNPVPYSTVTVVGDKAVVKEGDPTSITLDQYSLDDQHHPLLMLMKINGSSECVSAKTKYPYVGEDKPGNDNLDSSHIVATYSALMAKKGSATDGEIFEVTNDENQKGYYIEDSASKRIKTRYQYVAETDTFDLVWVDLAMYDNPLSSAVKFNYFLFDEMPATVTKNIYLYEEDGFGGVRREDTPTSTSVIALDTQDFTDSNLSSFTKIDANENANFEDEIEVFNGDITGKKYLGIVIDYYHESIEYISSYYLGHEYMNEGVTFVCDWEMTI